MSKKITLDLPWPPTVNTYWRRIRRGNGTYTTILSKNGRNYLEALKAAVYLQGGAAGLEGRLAVAIEARPPDDRRRDLDNLFKAPLDGLAKAGVYEDDSQIDDLRIVRGKKISKGRLKVQIEEMGAEMREPTKEELWHAMTQTETEIFDYFLNWQDGEMSDAEMLAKVKEIMGRYT